MTPEERTEFELMKGTLAEAFRTVEALKSFMLQMNDRFTSALDALLKRSADQEERTQANLERLSDLALKAFDRPPADRTEN